MYFSVEDNTPDNWQDLRAVAVDTGEVIGGVVEGDTDEGWLRVLPWKLCEPRANLPGYRVVDRTTGEVVSESLGGRVRFHMRFDFDSGEDAENFFDVVRKDTGEKMKFVVAADTLSGRIRAYNFETNVHGVAVPAGDDTAEEYDGLPFCFVERNSGVVLAETAG